MLIRILNKSAPCIQQCQILNPLFHWELNAKLLAEIAELKKENAEIPELREKLLKFAKVKGWMGFWYYSGDYYGE